jgi:hypothetical protein
MATSLVITSIAAPNPVMAAFAEGCRENAVDFIVIGDAVSPPDFTLSGCDFWSLERQAGLGKRLAEIIPQRHYSRKNLGYLVAMQRGADVIIESDDDNFPRKKFWEKRELIQQVPLLEKAGWVNIYQYFTSATIWPRGFPLELIRQPAIPLSNFQVAEAKCPIQQGLADENPDVDAVYRLVNPLPQSFNQSMQVALGDHSWCPFNSQNTTWFKEAFPLLYLPSCCSFRMTDIWRSFVAQRICRANDWQVLFHGPTVWQERNEHNLLKDFSDEVVGYLNNAAMCELLDSLEIIPGTEHLAQNLLTCYQAFIGLGVVGEGEIALLEAWLEGISEFC